MKKGYKILDNSFHWKTGLVKMNINNTLSHELAKTKLSYMFKKIGRKIITEAIFINGKRGDVYCPEELECYEVLESETFKQFRKKKRGYPKKLEVYGFKAENILKDNFEI